MDAITGTLFPWAFGLSLAYNLVPGPVTAETLRRGTANGFRPALLVRLGSLAGTLVWAAAAFTGAGVLAHNPPTRLVLGVAGTLLLLRLAWGSLRAVRAAATAPVPAGGGRRGGDFVAGAAVALASPLELAFWLGIAGALLAGAGGAEQAGRAGLFLAGFVCADLLFSAALAALVTWGRRVAGLRLARGANLLCGLTLGYFALHLGASTLRLAEQLAGRGV